MGYVQKWWGKEGMPRIVDHDRYREELARRAVDVFREHGYHGLSMRRIAREIGVSKGVLYHYFPSKHALFEACSRQATEVAVESLPPGASRADRERALVHLAERIEDTFAGELTVLLDYTRGRSPDDISRDPQLRASLGRYRDSVATLVGKNLADAVLAQMFGVLFRRMIDGRSTSMRQVCDVLEALEDCPPTPASRSE